jgi:hypothetical protein
MSTITIPRPDLTAEDVTAALREGFGPRYQARRGQRSGRWVNWSAPHSGQCRYTSAGWLPAAINAFSRSSSARSSLDGPATEIMLIDVTRRRAADLGTRQL